jgi:hypothetical protein
MEFIHMDNVDMGFVHMNHMDYIKIESVYMDLVYMGFVHLGSTPISTLNHYLDLYPEPRH